MTLHKVHDARYITNRATIDSIPNSGRWLVDSPQYGEWVAPSLGIAVRIAFGSDGVQPSYDSE